MLSSINRLLIMLWGIAAWGWAGADSIRLADGATYDGGMENGVLQGQGVLEWANGDRYEGQFHEGLMHGQGLLLFGADRYQGHFQAGKPEGQGIFEYADGSRFEGAVKLGYPTGQGIFSDSTGDLYQGEFQYGRPMGQGKIRYQDGTEYEGEFVNGLESGRGEMRLASGDVYRGIFEDRVITSGSWEDPSGNRYEGQFKNWRFGGEGTYISGGDRYSGNFDDGYLMQGVHERADGGRYEGEFDGFFNYDGDGRLVAADGDVFDGEFSYGDYLGPKTTWFENLAEGAVLALDALIPGQRVQPPEPDELIAEQSLYLQSQLLDSALQALAPQQPEQIDLYVVQVAGDGSQEVFRREVEFAEELYASRWNLADRTVNLVNSRNSVDRLPMATRTSLRKTLTAVAEVMDREQDILWVYLTSHGSSDHEFSLDQNGMRLPDLSAAELGEMLSAIEVSNKVVVVAACYSGGFIPHLDDGQTLVMTSARADRVSFGCADENEMTDFGRAFLAESLAQSETIVEAFELSKAKVAQWEQTRDLTASEPQILRAEGVEKQLARWRAQQQRTSP